MIAKHLLLGIFSLLTFVTYAQTPTKHPNDPQSQMTEFKLETESIEKLKNLDWNHVREMFKDNNKDQEISIAIAYVNKAKTKKSKARLDNFQFEATGKTSDLDDLIKRMGTALEKMVELEENY